MNTYPSLLHHLEFSMEDRFKQVYESDMIGILFWDTTGLITEANDALLNMIGYSREEMLNGGLNWINITPQEYSHLDQQAYMRLVSGETVVPYEKQYFHKDGHRIDILIRSALVEGSIEVGMASILDITEKKQAEHALRKSKEEIKKYAAQLEHSNRELQQFAQNVAYGVQVPLRKIHFFSQYIKSYSSNSLNCDALDALERIIHSAERTNTIIRDLLEVSRISKKRESFQNIDLSQVMKEVYYDLYFLLKETGGRIEIGNLLAIEADPALMQQMLGQLIEYSLTTCHKEKSPWVKISSERIEDNLCKIIVEDNSEWNFALETDKLFDPLIHAYSKKDHPSNRIKLSLVKKIIEQHQGSIRIEGNPARGVQYTIFLPIAQLAE